MALPIPPEGVITHEAFSVAADGSDVDQLPDVSTISGLSVTLTPSVKSYQWISGGTARTYRPEPITLAYDLTTGHLGRILTDGTISPDPVVLPATKAVGIAPTWAWEVKWTKVVDDRPVADYLGSSAPIVLEAGATVDLSDSLLNSKVGKGAEPLFAALVAAAAEVETLRAETVAARDEAVTHTEFIAAPADEQVATYVDGTVGAATQAAVDARVVALAGDTSIAAHVATPGGATRAALNARDKQRGAVYITDYGAVGDGVTDDTLAIRAAIAATPAGGKCIIPPTPNGYLLKQQGTDNYLLRVTGRITLQGQGPASMLLVDAGVPSTTDVLLVQPPTSGQTKGYEFSGFVIYGAAGAALGRHAIHLDLTAVDSTLSDSRISGLLLYPTVQESIKLTNPTNTDGFFTSEISQNLIYSGMKLDRCGDSVTIRENTITGYGRVDISLVDGSNSLVFEKNNVTCRGGFRIRSGHAIRILHNNFEGMHADTTGTPSGAFVDIDGSEVPYSWGLLAVEFRGNNIGFGSNSPGGIDAIRVNKARSALIEANHISHKTSNHIVITALATETIIGHNLFSADDPGGYVVDLGKETIRRDTTQLTAVGARRMYMALAAVLRTRSNENQIVTDKQVWRPNTLAAALTHVSEWNIANASNTKQQLATQRRNADDTLEPMKVYGVVGDGYMQFYPDCFVLMDPGGGRWRVAVNSSGVISTTKII